MAVTRYLARVAIGAMAAYLALSLTVALFRPADVAATVPASTSVLLRPEPFEQAPLTSFSTITVPATPTGPAVMETAVVTVTEYVEAPLPTSITGFLEEYPYTTTATLMGMTSFFTTVIWASLTFVMWCRLKIAMRADKKRNQEARQKLMDLEKAPDKLDFLLKETDLARNRHRVVSEMDLKQLMEEVGRRT